MWISLHLSCLGVGWDSWTCIFIFFLNFGKLWGHCFFLYFSYFFFSFPSEIPTMNILVCLMILQFLQDLFIYLCFCLFFLFAFFFLFPNRILLIVSSSSLLILSSSYWNMLLTPLVSFSFQLLYFKLQNFYLVPFNNFYLFIDILILFVYLFPDFFYSFCL